MLSTKTAGNLYPSLAEFGDEFVQKKTPPATTRLDNSCQAVLELHPLHFGYLKRKGGKLLTLKQWNRCYVVLQGGSIHIFPGPNSKKPNIVCSLFGYDRVEIENTQSKQAWAFRILPLVNCLPVMTFATASKPELTHWFLQLRVALLEAHNQPALEARRLVERVNDQSIPADDSSGDLAQQSVYDNIQERDATIRRLGTMHERDLFRAMPMDSDPVYHGDNHFENIVCETEDRTIISPPQSPNIKENTEMKENAVYTQPNKTKKQHDVIATTTTADVLQQPSTSVIPDYPPPNYDSPKPIPKPRKMKKLDIATTPALQQPSASTIPDYPPPSYDEGDVDQAQSVVNLGKLSLFESHPEEDVDDNRDPYFTDPIDEYYQNAMFSGSREEAAKVFVTQLAKNILGLYLVRCEGDRQVLTVMSPANNLIKFELTKYPTGEVGIFSTAFKFPNLPFLLYHFHNNDLPGNRKARLVMPYKLCIN